MQQVHRTISLATRGKGLYEFTSAVEDLLSASNIVNGLLTLFCRHTSCSLLIQENADPDVRTDLKAFFARLAPENMEFVIHTTEGPDDMPAHIASALTQTSIGIPVVGGKMVLGTWQGIYLFEHRVRPHQRSVAILIMGDLA